MSHSITDRINGINENCILSKEDIKKCYGYVVIGDRACNSKNVPGLKKENIIRICIHNKLKNNG